MTDWKEIHRTFVGIDVWTGGKTVPGFCAMYVVESKNIRTNEFRTYLVRGTPKYLGELANDDVIALAYAYQELQAALRRHAER